jgi:hypothetical protein
VEHYYNSGWPILTCGEHARDYGEHSYNCGGPILTSGGMLMRMVTIVIHVVGILSIVESMLMMVNMLSEAVG